MKFFMRFVLLIISVIAAVAAAFGIFVLCEKLIVSKDYYFYQFHPVAEQAMIFLIVIPIVTVIGVVLGRFRRQRDEVLEDMYDLFFVWRRLGKARLLLIAVWLFCIYCCITSATVVTEDALICHSALHPSGIRYDYKDVAWIRSM